MNEEAIKPVCDRRAGGTSRFVVGSEHEMVNEELRAPFKQVHQRGVPLVSLKLILFVDSNPWQFLPSPRQLIAVLCKFLLRFQQFKPCGQPLFPCPGLMCCHRLFSSFCRYDLVFAAHEINLAPDIEMVGVTNVSGFGWTR